MKKSFFAFYLKSYKFSLINKNIIILEKIDMIKLILINKSDVLFDLKYNFILIFF